MNYSDIKEGAKIRWANEKGRTQDWLLVLHKYEDGCVVERPSGTHEWFHADYARSYELLPKPVLEEDIDIYFTPGSGRWWNSNSIRYDRSITIHPDGTWTGSWNER